MAMAVADAVPAEPRIDERETALIQLVQERLGLEAVTRESLDNIEQNLRLAERLQPLVTSGRIRIDELEQELARTWEQLENDQLELAIAEEERSRLEDEIRYLRRRARERQDYEIADSPLPPEARTDYPDDFEDLVNRLTREVVPGVLFSGDPTPTLALSRIDHLGVTLQRAWEAALVLGDYREAKLSGRCRTNVHSYLSEPHDGRKVPLKRHAPNESERTMQRWGSERVFPVPPQVDPGGSMTMTAHFKLHTNDTTAPRMHYYDNVNMDKTVYIGIYRCASHQHQDFAILTGVARKSAAK